MAWQMVQLMALLMAYCSGRQMARPTPAALAQRVGRQEERTVGGKAVLMVQQTVQRLALLTVLQRVRWTERWMEQQTA